MAKQVNSCPKCGGPNHSAASIPGDFVKVEGQNVWVTLPISSSEGNIVCAYCGAEYQYGQKVEPGVYVTVVTAGPGGTAIAGNVYGSININNRR